jgi:MraZ protein
VATMQRPVLVGEYELTLDAKNRVAVPARLRSAFVDGIYLTKEPEPCLGGWNPEEFGNRLEEDTAATDPGTAARRDVKRALAANAIFLELDRQGRVTLPMEHLKYAGVTHDVTVIGAQDHLEIWDRAVWARYLARLEEEADVTAAEHAT